MICGWSNNDLRVTNNDLRVANNDLRVADNDSRGADNDSRGADLYSASSHQTLHFDYVEEDDCVMSVLFISLGLPIRQGSRILYSFSP